MRTRSLPAPPHSTTTNDNWMVPLYYSEQWNCESNLYRVTIALLPPMLNHFSLLNCAVSRD
jgi:hypothetical protein